MSLNHVSHAHIVQFAKDASICRRIRPDYGLGLSGQFKLSDALVSFDNSGMTDLAGGISWPGGVVHIETPQRIHPVTLPPMQGKLSMEDDNARLLLAADNRKMIDILLKPSGWAEVAITFAFMALAKLPLPGNPEAAGPDEPAILLEEKIFQGRVVPMAKFMR